MTTKQLELTLTSQERTLLDYILMEFLTVEDSDRMTIPQLHQLMLLLKEEFTVVDWSSQMDNNYVDTCKKFCKILGHYILVESEN
jgi:hypothetical protein